MQYALFHCVYKRLRSELVTIKNDYEWNGNRRSHEITRTVSQSTARTLAQRRSLSPGFRSHETLLENPSTVNYTLCTLQFTAGQRGRAAMKRDLRI